MLLSARLLNEEDIPHKAYLVPGRSSNGFYVLFGLLRGTMVSQ